ncbi:DUF7285 family protein [Natronosalvus halobius]|uniref:DUF7285 family protein n=1 Tax=Natronosalvus halobius TaxID=2953746 RepID=UPI0020A0CEAC|nr:hypothetical protein [Natronosalvus halobius]USZ72847.1 hypothetical protein NGM15_05955 [Natronosalvus halobius]
MARPEEAMFLFPTARRVIRRYCESLPHPSTAPPTDRSNRRGQTEPLAALVAVATVCLALGVYAGALSGMGQTSSDRSVAEPTLEAVHATIAADGVYDPNGSDDPVGEIPADRLPIDRTVTVTVTTLEKGHPETRRWARYVDGRYERGSATGDRPPSIASTPEGKTSTGDTVTRPIAVLEPSGKVSSATLHVEVRS